MVNTKFDSAAIQNALLSHTTLCQTSKYSTQTQIWFILFYIHNMILYLHNIGNTWNTLHEQSITQYSNALMFRKHPPSGHKQIRSKVLECNIFSRLYFMDTSYHIWSEGAYDPIAINSGVFRKTSCYCCYWVLQVCKSTLSNLFYQKKFVLNHNCYLLKKNIKFEVFLEHFNR